jgi:hypothetical protein
MTALESAMESKDQRDAFAANEPTALRARVAKLEAALREVDLISQNSLGQWDSTQIYDVQRKCRQALEGK